MPNYDADQLCTQIQMLYPEVGECGVGVLVGFDAEKDAWRVTLRRANQELVTYLDPDDTRACMDGEQCVHLGVEIKQLIANADARAEVTP